ncbi:LysR family transcriptional regulator [Actinacidiphila bryophytorum]|uniref:DNA-binding transcriptional regulator, LysR family n=1 Tax=Actinacidiphila bryophytorum TaxID=1436133 RepID=A0A9W4E4V9_9ACTN|nr:LysR family transcriptional regulator [Actinacidiphila bryophytorum]MBM9439124.1 LysR family transcriptional regulator [Actinacidiphila bryophytorum]MBN6544281.1 LysR family transcriptional regulator [Actinacidiphila bryophytorum]CAG7622123.1 DNA-binding transcriptional regulator, LysR family [Actinacidiphila bryophytorum]
MLSLERLRILHAIDTYGSVSAAADVLSVTTSAVSQQMAKLERETGQSLLAKSGRGVRLTDAGRLLSGHAERILSLVELAHADLEAHRGAALGDLIAGAFPTAVRGLFPAALTELRREHPQLRTMVHELEPHDSLARLNRGDIDLAVVLDWYNKPLSLPGGLAKAPLFDDIVDVALPAGHPLEGRSRIDLDELAGESWIAWPDGGFCHEWLLFTLRGKGIEPRIAHHAEEHATVLALVAAGLGVAVIPRLGRDPMPEGVRVVPVRHTMRRHVYAVWREDADRRPAIRAAVDALGTAARAYA